MEKTKSEVKEDLKKLESEIIVGRRKINIESDKNIYWAVLPNPSEILEARDEKSQYFAEKFKEGKILTKQEIDKKAKERGIDSGKLKEKLKDLQVQFKEANVSLAQTKDSEEKVIEKKRNLVIDLTNQIQKAVSDVTEFYEYSLEYLTTTREHLYLCYKCCKIEKDGKLTPVWNNFDGFLTEKDGYKASQFLNAFIGFYLGVTDSFFANLPKLEDGELGSLMQQD